MIIDLHIHTLIGSGDSKIEYNDLVPYAKKAGLDGICLTEHSCKKSGMSDRLSEEYDFLILEGFEMSTDLGDVLIYGVEEIPVVIYHCEDVREIVLKNNGIMYAAHPFRSEITRIVMRSDTPKITLEQAVSKKIFSLVDGIEVMNGWGCQEEIDFTQKVAEALGFKGIGGSDAHMSSQIGTCATVFENPISCETDLLMQLRNGTFSPHDYRPPDKKGMNSWKQ